MKKTLHVNLGNAQRNKRNGDEALPTVMVYWHEPLRCIAAHVVHIEGPSVLAYNYDKGFVELTAHGRMQVDGQWYEAEQGHPNDEEQA